MPTGPTRPDAHQAFPEQVKRWNAMFDDKTNRNLDHQRGLHAEMCDSFEDCATHQTINDDVHHSPDFVLWHRAFLYYHEQILSAMGSGDVGLPYWNWSRDLGGPAAYLKTQFKFKDSLRRSPDELDEDVFSPEAVQSWVALLRTYPPATAARKMFDDPQHALPHAYFGWDHLGSIMDAAGDPLFYGHHANLDRLATHIFEKGWPASSGISYHFFDPKTGNTICTTLDRFTTMASTYEGDSAIDTSAYRTADLLREDKLLEGVYSRIRLEVRFPKPLRIGRHDVVTSKGDRLGQIASLMHHGSTQFALWVSTPNFSKARTDGIYLRVNKQKAEITEAVQVARME